MVNVILHFILMLFSVAYIAIGAHVYSRDWKSRTNVFFLATCVSLGIWAFGYGLMAASHSIDSANAWRVVSAIGWCSFYANWFCFVMFLTRRNGKATALLALAAYALASFFFVNTINYVPGEIFTETIYGWTPSYPNNDYEKMFLIYYMTLMSLSLYSIHDFGKKSDLLREHDMASIITISVILSLAIGALTDTLIPVMMGLKVFPMAIVFIMISIMAVRYALLRLADPAIMPALISGFMYRDVDMPILILGKDLKILEGNDAAVRLFGCDSVSSLESESVGERFISDSIMESISGMTASFKNRETTFYDKVNGKEIDCVVTSSILKDDFDDLVGTCLMIKDITDVKKARDIMEDYNNALAEEVDKRTSALEKSNGLLLREVEERRNTQAKVKQMLYYDNITNLPNKIYFDEYVDRYISESCGDSSCFAILYIDLDDFKYVNDTLGHSKGDELLSRVAIRLREILCDAHLIARSGGDEFFILLKNLSSDFYLDNVISVSHDIIHGFTRPYVLDGNEIFITASIGASFYPHDGDNTQTLIKNTDIALCSAKRQGKNTFVVSSEKQKASLNRRADIRNRLYKVLENDELSLCYQPQISIGKDRVTGLEALLRWRQYDGSFISPSEFIPITEETGLIVPIGYWVIETASKKVKTLSENGFGEALMAVNISVNQLRESDFVERVDEIIKKVGISASSLEFEITERIGLKGLLEAEKTLSKIKSLGIKVSIDDFGTEFSSFVNLKELPVDKIKISMDFIKGLNHNRKDDAIVTSIIELCRMLGLDAIAEGVETKEQVDFLNGAGCGYIQGYYYFKPLSDEEVDKLDFGDSCEKSI